MKKILYIAAFVSILTYQTWQYLPKGSFYVGIAAFITLLCLYLYLSNRKSFICLLLFCLSVNNLADELFFDPTKMQLNELIFALSIPLIWVINTLRYAGENCKQ